MTNRLGPLHPDFGYPFAIKRTNAYSTPLERKPQTIKDPKGVIRKAKHTNWEAVLNKMLGNQGFLNDDEYKFMSKKGAY